MATRRARKAEQRPHGACALRRSSLRCRGPGLGTWRGSGPTLLYRSDQGGDISSELAVDAEGRPVPHRRLQAVDRSKGEKAVPNPNSGLVWEFDADAEEYEGQMHRSLSNVAIADGLAVALDFSGLIHCLDAKTGERFWFYDALSAFISSPLIVDGKVYVGDDDGDVRVFHLSKDPDVAMRNSEPIAEINMEHSVYASPVFANGTLYVATRSHLYAVADDDRSASTVDEGFTNGHWPQWRGPNRDNISSETGLLKKWPEGGPPLRWKVNGLGNGISPVSLADGRVITLSQYESTEYVRALDERTGRHLWSAPLAPAIPQNPYMRWLTQRPPTIDGERLYAVSLLGELVCLRTSDGKELWRTNYLDVFAGEKGVFGFSDCPVVDGDKLICTPGGPKASVVALDKRTGTAIWSCDVRESGRAAYSNGVIADIAGKRQFVTFLEKALVGISLEDGKLLWRVDGGVDNYWHPHTPIVRDRFVLCLDGFRVGGIKLLELGLRDGRFSAKEVYAKPIRFLGQYVDDAVVLGEYLYDANRGVTTCIHWRTGEVIWRKRVGGTSRFTFADGRLYRQNMDGKLQLNKVSHEGLSIEGELTLPRSGGPTTPVITSGRLYVREDDQLFCFDIRADALDSPRAEPRTIALAPPEEFDRFEKRRRLKGKSRGPDAIFVPTPQDVVEQMLKFAKVEQDDLVVDLGSGDGRIVITAAKKYGAKAVGYEIDKELVDLAKKKTRSAKVDKLVTIEHEDIFNVDLSKVDVVAVYILPRMLDRLKPQLAKLKPGARIVSHEFEIPGIKPEKSIKVRSSEDGNEHFIHLWTTPLVDE